MREIPRPADVHHRPALEFRLAADENSADRQPVAITQHWKPRYVLMTYDEFEAMKKQE